MARHTFIFSIRKPAPPAVACMIDGYEWVLQSSQMIALFTVWIVCALTTTATALFGGKLRHAKEGKQYATQAVHSHAVHYRTLLPLSQQP